MPTPAAQVEGLPAQVVSGLKDTDPVWTTAEMQAEFTVHAFLAPFVEVTRKSDGAHGSLQFSSNPRYYFAFVQEA